MPMEVKASMISDLATLTARLDGLSPDQNPHDLLKTLKSALTDRALYRIFLSSLAADEARAKAFLEVFDKVGPRNSYRSVKLASSSLYETGPYSPARRCKDIQEV